MHLPGIHAQSFVYTTNARRAILEYSHSQIKCLSYFPFQPSRRQFPLTMENPGDDTPPASTVRRRVSPFMLFSGCIVSEIWCVSLIL